MIQEKGWQEFRETGLFMLVNSFLHVFGWCLVVEVDSDTKEVGRCFQARTKYRGFSEQDTDDMHKKIASYMEHNSTELNKEVNEQ